MTKCLLALIAVVSYSWAPQDSIWGDAKTDQEKCQAEADYMAKYNKYYHVGKCIGHFEGIGYGGSHPNIATCKPSYKMQLTGDAVAQDKYGKWVRVRSWRRISNTYYVTY